MSKMTNSTFCARSEDILASVLDYIISLRYPKQLLRTIVTRSQCSDQNPKKILEVGNFIQSLRSGIR